MKYTELMLAWTPPWKWLDESSQFFVTKGLVEVGPWPDKTRWSRIFLNTGGACYRDLHEMNDDELSLRLFIDFNTLVVRDKIDPQQAHNEFLKIDEYRKRIAPDTRGADQ